MKKFQIEKGKYFKFELVNWEMEEEEDKKKRIRPRELASGQKKHYLGDRV